MARPPTRAELLGRMRSSWSAFSAAVSALDRGRLGERTSAGWTYKEMLAHVAAWHDLTARRLRAYRETGAVAPPDGEDAGRVFEALGFAPDDRDALLKEWHFDRFNAAVARAAKGRAAEDVLRELGPSFDRVAAEVAALSDEQIAADVQDGRSFVDALVDGNTFGHYAEHADEVGAQLP